MFNRHFYEKCESIVQKELIKQEELKSLLDKRKQSRSAYTEHYKQRVRDFLVKMASRPLQLGQYQPPITDIIRELEEDKILANAQLYINGFKSNKERIQNAQEENKILDYSPTQTTALNHSYRSRLFQKQIQPEMKFKGNVSPKMSKGSKSLHKLQPLNPEVKMHFKAVEQMGNKLKSMEQKQSDRIGLLNKLQTVYGGKEINLEQTSLTVLQSCKLLRAKTLKTLSHASLYTQKSTTS